MQKTLLFATFMFWGAALMWSVDGIASVIEGEPFFDISRSDTILGFIILGTAFHCSAFPCLFKNSKQCGSEYRGKRIEKET